MAALRGSTASVSGQEVFWLWHEGLDRIDHLRCKRCQSDDGVVDSVVNLDVRSDRVAHEERAEECDECRPEASDLTDSLTGPALIECERCDDSRAQEEQAREGSDWLDNDLVLDSHRGTSYNSWSRLRDSMGKWILGIEWNKATAVEPISPYCYTGGTTRLGDLYVWHFGISGAFSPIPGQPLPDTIDVFMAGGGGANQGFNPGGGGEAAFFMAHTAPTTTVTAVVGVGQPAPTGSGTNTTFDGLTVHPGNRASGAFSGINAGSSYNGHTGGLGLLGTGGGGGGHVSNGGAAPSIGTGGDAGGGLACDWETGSDHYYCRGGRGYGSSAMGGRVIGATIVGPDGSGGDGDNVGGAGATNGTILVRYIRADLL